MRVEFREKRKDEQSKAVNRKQRESERNSGRGRKRKKRVLNTRDGVPNRRIAWMIKACARLKGICALGSQSIALFTNPCQRTGIHGRLHGTAEWLARSQHVR